MYVCTADTQPKHGHTHTQTYQHYHAAHLPSSTCRLTLSLSLHTLQGVGEPPGEAAAVATRSTHPTGGTVRAASHTRGTGGPRAGVKEVESKPRTGRRVTQQTSHAVVGGENPPLPDRLVERLKANDWEDRQEAISVLERFVDQHPKALEPHMNKVLYYHVCIY